MGCCIRTYLGLEVITDIQGSQFLNQLDHSLCFQQCLLHFAHHAQGKGRTCSVLHLSIFRLRGDDPILILSEHPPNTVFLPLARFTCCAWNGGACAVCCRCQECSIDWDSLPFTDLTFHVTDCFSISSLQCDCGLLRRLTLI